MQAGAEDFRRRVLLTASSTQRHILFMKLPSQPPFARTKSGALRRVGVEIEFGALPLQEAAHIVQRLFGGKICEAERFYWQVEETKYGTFSLELDSQYAHGEGKLLADEEAQEGLEPLLGKLQKNAREVIGEVSKAVVPNEITCPPIPFTALGEIDELTGALAAAGAQGTKGSPFYAFGLQLNPEVAEESASYILAHLRAFCLLRDWLRAEIDVDRLRQFLPFADPFEPEYVRHILDPHYAPELDRLIDDYLEANPTRNRELDLLPLFTHLDEARVKRKVGDALIKARPTFHYRLPDSRLGQHPAPVTREWQRWLAVEHLAADGESLTRLAAAYLAESPSPERWAEAGTAWIKELAAT
ncbi:conserved protein [Tepidicaulis marinus]|uniref:Conserved protein n=2 Tax=Tepidicaulis marinus TaxID=1333998 RepID=A0A081B8K6_9HYPH|nr:conserved protein [Tepidicaulis marinus]